MSRNSTHTEWLSLMDISGPFLAVPVLERVFPQGLEALDADKRKSLRNAYDEWRDAVDEEDPLLSALHREWIKLVFTEVLGYGDVLVSNDDNYFVYTSPNGLGTFSPDFVVQGENDEKPRLLISIQPPGTDLEKVPGNDSWPTSPIERMTLLCRATGVKLGVITDGERWTLVNAPIGNTSSHASWYARLWFQEPATFKAFLSLLEVRRFFGPEEDNVGSLLEESLEYNEEVTDTLGDQVRRAVEVLVQCLDKADQDRNRELLQGVSPKELYDAGLTVMMRLVFVLCAEERGLLLLGDTTYDRYYAVSTLRGQLAENAELHGPEVLERRYDAWARILALFRGIYGGIEHETLRMPALGGSLSDPDRFPFLEGRAKGTTWKEMSTVPLPIDNRTVLLLLEALQVLEQHGGALTLSYRALDVEQIGHVYEGLLEYTVKRMPDTMLGFKGTRDVRNSNLSLVELESLRLRDKDDLIDFVKETTLRSQSAIKNDLERDVDENDSGRLVTACSGNSELVERVRPFFHLLRKDAWGEYIIYEKDAFAITLGQDRRETGTHYTPKVLTEEIVEKTLEPIVYIGPAEGNSRDEWKLKNPAEIFDLKICDPAMGSGAFLVQVCRYLSEKLVESWGIEEKAGKAITFEGEVKEDIGDCDPMPESLDDRLLIARRIVAEKCIYGVDMNPAAVELAKLSVWLVTMAKGRPFGFLDHNLRCGDSLLGIHRLDQLTKLCMNPDEQKQFRVFGETIEQTVHEAVEIRKKIRKISIKDIRDVEVMTHLDSESREKVETIELIADAMIGEALKAGSNESDLEKALNKLSICVGDCLNGKRDAGEVIREKAIENLSLDLSQEKPPRKLFHWPLEFPEVFKEEGGFDAIVGNPPFMGGQKITGNLGTAYREYLVFFLAFGKRGSADLCAYFFLRNASLITTKGQMGLLATNTIAQGDTREVALEQLGNGGWCIISAISKRKWPGKATVLVAIVWLRKGKWNGQVLLDGKSVESITSYLVSSKETSESPYRLVANSNKSFQGSIPLGGGFILDPEKARELTEGQPNYKKIIKPYLSGDDILTNFDQHASRWVIDFRDMTLEEAKKYKGAYDIIERLVKPEREKNKRKTRRDKWWQFAERAIGLYTSLEGLDLVLFHSFTSKYIAFAFVDAKQSFAGPHVVVVSEDFGTFGALQSTFHDIWARQWCSTHGDTLRYATSDLFETFPFPFHGEALRQIGEEYHIFRKNIMKNIKEGLTALYNRFHDPEETLQEIIKLRELHVGMDIEVAKCYGCSYLKLEHGFHETRQGTRFTVSEAARREILQRLLKLNHERHEEEVRQGLHEKKKPKDFNRKRKTKNIDNGQMELFSKEGDK